MSWAEERGRKDLSGVVVGLQETSRGGPRERVELVQTQMTNRVTVRDRNDSQSDTSFRRKYLPLPAVTELWSVVYRTWSRTGGETTVDGPVGSV